MPADVAIAPNGENLCPAAHEPAAAAIPRSRVTRVGPTAGPTPLLAGAGKTAAAPAPWPAPGKVPPTALSGAARGLVPALVPTDAPPEPRRRQYADWKRAAALFARGHTVNQVAGALGVPPRQVKRNLRRSKRLRRWIAEAREAVRAGRRGRQRHDWRFAARLMAYDYSEAEIAERLGCTVRHFRRRYRESADFHIWLDREDMRRACRAVRIERLQKGQKRSEVRAAIRAHDPFPAVVPPLPPDYDPDRWLGPDEIDEPHPRLVGLSKAKPRPRAENTKDAITTEAQRHREASTEAGTADRSAAAIDSMALRAEGADTESQQSGSNHNGAVAAGPSAPLCLCGEPPVAQARDHKFRRDLAAAGDWVEGSGCFDTGRIVALRERLSELVVPGTGRQPAVDLRGSPTMEFRRSRDELAITDLLHRPGDITRPVPLAAAGDDGQDATPDGGASDRPDEAETAQADPPGIPTEADMWRGFEPGYAKQVKERVQSLVEGGRKHGMPVAAGLLQHYLDGSGEPVDLDPEWLRRQTPLAGAQHVNEQRFRDWMIGEEEDKKIGNPMVETHGDKRISFTIREGEEIAVGSGGDNPRPYWQAVFQTSVRDITDLRYALGNGQIRSEGEFVFRREGDHLHVEGVVDHLLDKEKYDFDHSTWEVVLPDPIRGTFMVTGDDMRLLEEHEGAKTFDVRGKWQSEVSGSFRIENGRAVDVEIRWRDRPSSHGPGSRAD